MYLLDTNIVIYIMKNTFQGLTDHLLSLDPSDISISSVTLFELEYGAENSGWTDKNRDKLYAFLSPFEIIPFDAGDAFFAGRFRALLKKQGSPIGPYDILIASQAYARDMTVITHNVGEFSRIPGLKIEDWVLLS